MALRILEIEKRMRDGDYSEDTVAKFKEALKHVPKDNRSEHCYYTAMDMGIRYKDQALELLRLGIEHYNGFWFELMRCHRFMGLIYEQCKEYDLALEEYNNALNAVCEEMYNQYLKEYSYLFLRVELHKSCFTYTDELFRYYNKAILASRYRGAYDEKLFYTAVARVIIYEELGQIEKAKTAYFTALTLLNMQNYRPLTHFLKTKTLSETLLATPEVTDFLNSLNGLYTDFC